MPRADRRSNLVLLVPAIWTVVGILAAGQLYLLIGAEGQHISFPRALAIQLPLWWFWAAITPLVLALGRRAPVDRDHWSRSVPLHIAVAVLIAIIHSVLYVGMNVWLFPTDRPLPELGVMIKNLLYNRLIFDLAMYGMILGIGYAMDSSDRLRLREVDSERLETELAKAELNALKMQLHPHFLFNTLNTIGVLVEEDPAGAREMITLLGDLLRATLDQAGVQEVPLRRELELLESYLAIERMRFSDRLAVSFEVAPETLAAVVPNLVLQPLVENAVRHAIAPRLAPGRIRISAARDGDVLRLQVIDDGAGVVPSAMSARGSAGLGLSTTRARLERLYGARAHLDLAPGAEGGTVATVTMPWRAATDV
ncbi:MAG TPA: histidine kinase [Gemmatimonadales bacterium]|jgi:sensor histidine kinase YesM|nr:histidine kinase [Gemmatimonadales bacterium]